MVVRKLQSVQQKWAQLDIVMAREGADERTLGRIYVEVVHAVSVYGLETWVMTPRSGRFWGGFHLRVKRRLTDRKPLRGSNGKCIYTLLVEAM